MLLSFFSGFEFDKACSTKLILLCPFRNFADDDNCYEVMQRFPSPHFASLPWGSICVFQMSQGYDELSLTLSSPSLLELDEFGVELICCSLSSSGFGLMKLDLQILQ